MNILNLSIEKIKLKLRDTQQNKWSLILKVVKVMKDKVMAEEWSQIREN